MGMVCMARLRSPLRVPGLSTIPQLSSSPRERGYAPQPPCVRFPCTFLDVRHISALVSSNAPNYRHHLRPGSMHHHQTSIYLISAAKQLVSKTLSQHSGSERKNSLAPLVQDIKSFPFAVQPSQAQ
ncbi:hypothetical protein VTJ04DRAFT_6902 [Mycothermus thermophilus]|uniref:uncharacterized protein n=1 Tax=Humicola insolens TaxID=85995 RepID=UPI0037446272